jgi:Transcriptional regulators
MATLKDIAKKAGVNKSTVSRALSGNSNISIERTNEIREIAKALGYIPNETAKVLAGKKAKTIGIILPEIDNYYASVASTIESRLRDRGYSLIIGQTGFKQENELHYLKIFMQKALDGIIINPVNAELFFQEFQEIRKALKVPIVFIESPVEQTDYDVVEIDNYCGVDHAIEHLYSLGHRKIGIISENLSSPTRLPAFIKAMERRGLQVDESLIKNGPERQEAGGYLRMQEMLSEKNRPTAIFAVYDTMAFGAMKAISDHGLKVPDDISIVGFDNVRESSYLNVPLTSVAPPVIEMSEIAVNTLMDRIEKDNKNVVQYISLKPKLSVKESTKQVQG